MGFSWPPIVPMHQMMNGQGRTRAPGLQRLQALEGGTVHREVLPMAVPDIGTLAVLPPRTVVRPHGLDVVITPELVADLYDPTLVISHSYVGPERRRTDRSADGRGTHSWIRRTLSVVLLTAAVVIPCTLIAARSLPPSTPGPAPAPSSAPSASTPPAAVHHGAQNQGATGQQIARAEAAYQKALARAGVAAPVASTGAGQVVRTTGPRRAAAAGASQARSEARAAAAARHQARVAARAEAQAARAATRAARAQARVARTGAGGAGTPGASGTSPGTAVPGT